MFLKSNEKINKELYSNFLKIIKNFSWNNEPNSFNVDLVEWD